MTVSDFIFDFLEKKGVKRVYMVSGSSAMWLTDALKRNEKLIPYCCNHEQAAAMAADVYGRLNNVPGACLVTIGPGATNAITGVAEAYLDSSPMFVISGQANSKLLNYQRTTNIRQKGTQSLTLDEIVPPITKYFVVVEKPEDIRFCMEKAYYMAMEGRRGPVWIDVPIDIQNKQIPEEMNSFTSDNEGTVSSDITEIISAFKEAKKPLVMAGNGVRNADCSDKLLSFCQKYCIPVVTSRGGIDVIDSENELFIGRPGAYGDRPSHFAISQCDFLLILGSRLSVSTIGYYPSRFAENAYKVMIDIDNKELDKEDVPINKKYCLDIADFLTILSDVDSTYCDLNARKKWVEHLYGLKKKYPIVLDEYRTSQPLNSYYFTEVLSKYTSENTDVIVDTGSVCNTVSQTWNLKKGQRYIISGGFSCMGFWAGSLGACREERNTIVLSGDGSVQMNIQEFATLAYYKFPVKLFVYNNNGYMLIRHNQHNYMNDRFLGVGPDSGVQTPDFCKVAEAYGLKSVKITEESHLVEKIKEVLLYKGPVVCEVMLEEFGTIAPKISSRVMPDGSLKAAEFDDLWPFIERDESDYM